MIPVEAMKVGALSVLAVALSVSPALSAKHHRLHFRRAHAQTLNLTRVNLHPTYDLDRPLSGRSFSQDRVPLEKSFTVAPGGWTGSVGYHASPGAGAVSKSDLSQAVSTLYQGGDKTVGAAVGIRF